MRTPALVQAFAKLRRKLDGSIGRPLAVVKTSPVSCLRILLGDPEGEAVAQRGADEGIGAEVMTARVMNALMLYRPLLRVQGVEIRVHRTVLYNSIYQADDALLVNTHAYGTPAANAPVMHLTGSGGEGPAATYLTSMTRIWATIQPCHQ